MAYFADGVLTGLAIKSYSSNSIYLEFTPSTSTFAGIDYNAAAVNYFTGEVIGNYYTTAPIPEPSARLAFAAGFVVVGFGLRRRHHP